MEWGGWWGLGAERMYEGWHSFRDRRGLNDKELEVVDHYGHH